MSTHRIAISVLAGLALCASVVVCAPCPTSDPPTDHTGGKASIGSEKECNYEHLWNCSECQAKEKIAEKQKDDTVAKDEVALNQANDKVRAAIESVSDKTRALKKAQDRYGDLMTQLKHQLKQKQPSESAGQDWKQLTSSQWKDLTPANLQRELQEADTAVTDAASDLEHAEKEVHASQAEANSAAGKLAKDEGTKTDLSTQLKNLHFGLGIGVTLLGTNDIVDTELTGDKIVRITNVQKSKVGVWLEATYLWSNIGSGDHWRWGSFVGLQLASTGGDTLNAFAFGPAVSWKVKAWCDDSDKSSFNIGIGPSLTKIQRLGDGIHANQPLPPGEQNIRYKSTNVWGGTLMFSFNVW